MEANFLETSVSALHHIAVFNNNVKYSTDYLVFCFSGPSDADAITIMRQPSATIKTKGKRLQI